MTDRSSPALAECLSLADVRERFGLSPRALRVLVLAHGLSRYRRLGDNHLYLRVADVERALADKAIADAERQTGVNVDVR